MSDSDKIWIKGMKLYRRYREVVHIGAFGILFVFTLGGNWDRWQARAAQLDTHERRISQLEYTNGQILQSLEDIKFFLHVPTRAPQP